MSFLFEEDILAKILIDSGEFERLIKSAQNANEQIKSIAQKMANNLLSQTTAQHDKPDADLYVRDLVNLDAYLTFLLTNRQRFNGKLIVFHQAVGEALPPNPELYTLYHTFWVYKDGLKNRLTELDVISNQVGNEVMKPLVKGLIQEANQSLKLEYTREADESLPSNPYAGQEQANDKANKNSKQPSKFQIGFSADESAIKNVIDDKNQSQSNAKSKQDLNALRDSMPFKSPNSLSPYDMYLFIHNVNNILQNNPKLISGPMGTQFERFNESIYSKYLDWQNFIAKLPNSNETPLNPSTPTTSDKNSLKEEVPFERGNRPLAMLTSLFGSTNAAREAAQRLLQMVNLTHQALLSITRSAQLVDLLGKDIVANQTNQASNYADSLTPFARGSI